MRIIGGRFRGKSLLWVSNKTTRPTTDRVKENIFNILTSMGVDFAASRVLTLFAGSGQIGIECYSRGSTDLVFNDTSPEAVGIIQNNCESVGLKTAVITLDYLKCLEKLKGQVFDLVFLDPPFADTAAPGRAAEYLLNNGMLSDKAVIVAETECGDLVFDGFSVRKKRYGRAVIYFLLTNKSK